ncbi:hypothetical protein GCM10020000_33800 [Streptomyces olivoverticillatus]
MRTLAASAAGGGGLAEPVVLAVLAVLAGPKVSFGSLLSLLTL